MGTEVITNQWPNFIKLIKIFRDLRETSIAYYTVKGRGTNIL